ncbi:DNA-binding domain-containing protein [Rhizobium tubonense]|uniref:DUF2063 domain-containing protein n=1 Tax=Rhizobium tubonense TaxID=484088 RepID=A0A2W4D3W1_9HYPH|nr:putative DNA-binding domain-containing protein [Rhizobium tubonense]PZM16875.1 DUF2063 domain-containing protein [Rhizobium tubonense]
MSIAIQTRFAGALLDTDEPVPEGLTSWNGPRPERRFRVYRNNVAVGLIGALASRFPMAEKIVGEEFFAAMAHEFIRLHPPRSPLLLNYGDEFADFVETFEPAESVGYLPDVIRLEAARGRAYHAADAAPLDTSAFASLPAERLPSLTFTLHPSASIVRSRHPAVTIWAMNVGEMTLTPIEDWAGEDALIVRPQMTVLVQRLPPGGAAFLQALADGAELGTAMELATEEADDFDLSANLAGALHAGAITAIS